MKVDVLWGYQNSVLVHPKGARQTSLPCCKNISPSVLHVLPALVGSKVMRIIHKCRRQGSGSASPKGCARALAPSQSYRFVNNSHDHPTHGRRPQIFPGKISRLCKVGNAKNPRASGQRPEGAADEINSCSEPVLAEFIMKQRSSAASWLKLKQLTEPSDNIIASSPLQDRVKP
jgi:hypothetical protein